MRWSVRQRQPADAHPRAVEDPVGIPQDPDEGTAGDGPRWQREPRHPGPDHQVFLQIRVREHHGRQHRQCHPAAQLHAQGKAGL